LKYILNKNNINSAKQKYIQPLQVLVYDSTGYLIWHRANCDIRGFPNLKWASTFETFKHNLPSWTKIDSSINVTEFTNMLKPIGNSSKDLFKRYLGCMVIVGWSNFMGRQNRKFIEEVLKLKNNIGDKYYFIYVNTDNVIQID